MSYFTKVSNLVRTVFLSLFLALTSYQGHRAAGQDDLYQLEQRAMKAAVDRVAPSVVRIETFGGLESVDGQLLGTGPTTGLIVSEDGHVISSAFNFVRQPASILVSLPGGERATAEIVARDHSRMLVLLKVHTEAKLAPAEAVPRSEMRVGQWTLAVGRTFAADQPNMSAGILSAVQRIWSKAIQTDANVSPSNYGGPLIDIQGRVLGVLVPLSPEEQQEMAGAEWYDSGIGFAIPLEDIYAQLDQLKQGEDLHQGLLGVSLDGKEVYTGAAVIAACHPRSPADKAGLRPQDKIVEVDGNPIERQAQLKHALGPKYAGDKVTLVVLRDSERLEKTVELVDELQPYEHPFLGILPERTSQDEEAVPVRYVYPDGPADQAGLQKGDAIVSLADQPAETPQKLRQRLAQMEPGQKVSITVERSGDEKELEVVLGTLPSDVPDSLPPADEPAGDRAADRPPVGKIEINIPEQPNTCWAYVPDNYDPRATYGLVVRLHEPGEVAAEALIERWKAICEERDLILLVPQSADPRRWLPTETEVISKAIDYVRKGYTIGDERIVVHGLQSGSALALLVGITQRETVRGLALVDPQVPGRLSLPANDPAQRLSFFIASTPEKPQSNGATALAERLKELKYPVTLQSLNSPPGELSAEQLRQLALWIDALDRI